MCRQTQRFGARPIFFSKEQFCLLLHCYEFSATLLLFLKPLAHGLSNPGCSGMVHGMLRQSICLLTAVACGCGAAMADSVQLKDNASITGKILAEKRDSVAIDVGFTVVVVPRSAIASISEGNDASSRAKKSTTTVAAAPAASAILESKSGFYPDR